MFCPDKGAQENVFCLHNHKGARGSANGRMMCAFCAKAKQDELSETYRKIETSMAAICSTRKNPRLSSIMDDMLSLPGS
jgi:hypothetical protein